MTRFSRVDGQGVGLKELRLTRELSLRGETRLYFGNGELIERETVVVGEQGGEEICWRRATGHRKPRGSRPKFSTAIITLTPLYSPTDHGSQTDVETIPVQARPPRYAPISHFPAIFNLGVAGESAVGKSRYFPAVRHTCTSQELILLQFGPQIREGSVR